METTPIWLTEAGPRYASLDRDLQVDVLVVGGGIAGVTAAYLLKNAGCKVALLERARIGGGETGHTTAHLTYVTDSRLSELVRDLGRMAAQATWDAGLFAIEEIFRIATREQIECGLQRVPGYLFAAEGTDLEKQADELHREAHLAAELGFDSDYLDRVPIAGKPGISFPNQAQFHPLQYIRGLAAAVQGGGSYVFENAEVQDFEENRRHANVHGYRVWFRHCVLATNTPLQGRSSTAAAMLRQTKLAAYSTYAVEGRSAHGRYPSALLWDTADPYLYIRITPGAQEDSMIVGGHDHKTGQEDELAAVEKLRQQARAWFPEIEFSRRWSGQVIETVDGLPYIGETASHEFVATGFAGNGMTFGTLAGLMARDWVLGQGNPWTELFAPDRKKLSATWEYLRENKDFPLYFIRGHLTAAETDDPASIAPGEGKIVRGRHGKVAAYRKDDGELSTCSAVCPHLGCIVAWNAAEKTWDCPCHGSRFQATGEVLAGPAESPLAARGVD